MTPLGPARWRVSGDVDAAAARQLVARFATLDARDTITLELGELDLVDGTACALCVDAVRVLVDRGLRVTLVESPQNLAHVLYRVGMLDRVTLVRTRTDEPTSS